MEPDADGSPGIDPPAPLAATKVVSDAELLQAPVRQALPAILAMLLSRVRNIGALNIVLAAGFILSGRIPSWAMAALPLVAIGFVALTVAAWWRFTFCVRSGELVVTKGVVFRETLVIPFAKIQSISLEEGLVQRIFGLVSATVDTAGSSDVEFAIQGIYHHQAEALRRLAVAGNNRDQVVAASSQVGTDQEVTELAQDAVFPQTFVPPPASVIARRSPGELFVLGMLGNPFGGLVLLGTLPLFIQETAGVLGIDEAPTIEHSISWSLPWIIAAVSAALLFVVGLLWFLIGVKNLVVNWGQELTTTPDAFGLTAGLLSRRSQASLHSKVQTVETSAGPLMRRTRFQSVRLRTIGSGDFSLSGLSQPELDEVRSVLAVPTVINPQRRISAHYVYRRVRLAAFGLPFVGVGLGLLNLWFIALVPLWFAVIVVPTIPTYRSLRWSVDDDLILKRTGVVFRTQVEMLRSKMQTVGVRQSWYQRSRGLADVAIANGESTIIIPMIPFDDAKTLRDELLATRRNVGEAGHLLSTS